MDKLDITSATGPDLTTQYLKKLRQLFITENSAAKLRKTSKRNAALPDDGQTA
jgi:hypothetical protein